MKSTPAVYCSILFFSIITLMPGFKSYGQNSAAAAFLPTLKTGFTENKGQVYDQFHKSNKDVKYSLHTAGMNIHLRKNSFSYDTYEMISKKHTPVQHDAKAYPNTSADSTVFRFHRVDISFPGSNPNPAIIPVYRSAHYITCYLPGNTEPIRVFQYQQIIYKDIYPGIDLVFTTGDGVAQRGFKYNFIVRPGANSSQIRLQYKGAASHIDNKKISIKVRGGQLEEKIPASFLSNEKEPGRAILKPAAAVNVSYINHGNGVYGFRIPSFDKTKTLIIDPVPDLAWGTYYGGYLNDWAYTITRSPDGSILVGGESSNPNLATTGAYQSVLASYSDAVLGKFDASGKLIWMTYYGGDQIDAIYGLCTDKSGNVFAAGITASKNGIATPGSFQSTHGDGARLAGADGFLVKFNAAGNRIWATYYGGTEPDYLHAVRVDAADNIFIAGWTQSLNAIATPGAFQTSYGSDAQPLHQGDALLAKFDVNGNRVWGTYYGGNDFDRFYAMDLDDNGNVFASGIAYSSGLASPGAFQTNVLTNPNNSANYEALLVSFDNAGNRRWATYYGGNNEDYSQALVCDHENNVIIGGFTVSTSGISTPGTYLTTYSGGMGDGFIAKFTGSGSRIWGTYYGGDGQEHIKGITTDANNNIILTGSSGSTKNIATANSYQPDFPGCSGPYIAKLNKNGGQVWGTYYGKGALWCAAGHGEAVVTDDAGNVYACGATNALQAIATCGAVQETWSQNEDMYVAMFSENIQSSTVSCTINTTNNGAVCSGTPLTFTAQVINGGTNPVYQWKVNGAIAGTNNSSFTATNLKNGDIVGCSVTANSNCVVNPSANSNNITVSILPSVIPAIAISQAPVGSICQGTPVVFTAVPGNQGTAPVYQWKINGIDAGANSPVFSTSDLADGDIISCNLTNQFSCNPVTTVRSNELIAAVTPQSTPSITIKSSVNSVCAGTEVTFTSETMNGGSNQTYQWMINEKPVGTGPNFSTGNLSAGDIVQCFLIPDKNTCVVPGTVASNKMGIDIYPIPALNITPQKPVINRNDSIQLQVTGSDISSYLWTPPVNISDYTVPNPYVWPKNSQEYTVTATSAKGCSNTKKVLVEVVVDVHVPSAFSPNHDGKNDTWRISGLDAYPNCIVNVFNRWGQRVFYSTGYTKPWDGTFNTRELPSSTFVYVIDCKNGTRPISGTVAIIH